jgi:uncharacterized protein (DUF924 family)
MRTTPLMDAECMTPDTIIQFWFDEIGPAQHWEVDPLFDRLIRDRFGSVHEQANRCELFAWRGSPNGRLAEIIVLDQFSRNMFRDTPRAFASDALALALAQESVAAGVDSELPPERRSFLYMPYMHSESSIIHALALPLFASNTPANTHEFELRHKAIIDQFGRYPHRNTILGRESTEQERKFLTQPGSRF